MRRTRKATRHSIVIWLSITLLLLQWGCAHAPPYPQPPSEEVRAALGTIGVVSAAVSSETQLEAATGGKLHGAGKGALHGGLMGVGLAAQGGYTIIAAPFTAAAGSVIGLGLGAIIARSGSEVKETEAALNKALGELKVQETVRDRVLQEARDKTRHTFVLVEDQVPYSSLADKGIDTVLEVGLVGLRFEGEGVNPKLTLVMNVRASLVRVQDETNVYSDNWTYSASGRKFTKWAADNAKQFREEVDRACQSLAEQIVKQLFLEDNGSS